ncbi:hypothetical protein DFA_05562 [Cavenderia fasciculata]|uniref:Uncharacterized protein n=1 Tax=Cavenderia fasciculata TaxID=261658 RepID=F4PLK8_CACFS|nr:uncharacterized protein DFA_05562 [Cavenderia fasciculata]EGG23430.1 hypothetical protein DFA_05562 [Cavenderia fasciculata]|eukprot:XP_004361281.1 hypothetical protein DFA_05562 [Cavenderia fasciculata]
MDGVGHFGLNGSINTANGSSNAVGGGAGGGAGGGGIYVKSDFKKTTNIFSKVYEDILSTYSQSVSNNPLKKRRQSTPPINLASDNYNPNYIIGCQLSVWHDTAGPVVEQLWTTPEYNLPSEFQSFMARQTLCGLDTKITSEEMRFNIYPEHSIMSSSIIFNARYNDKITKFALSLYMDLSKLSIYQHIHDIIADRLSMLASFILRNYCNNIADQISFTKELVLVCINLEHLYSSNYPHVDILSTFLMDAKPQDNDFFVKVITSHLQTNGSTVVFGTQQAQVLKWLDTLSLFLTPNEKALSTRILTNKEYIPDLVIQGLIDVSLKQIEENIYLSLKPVTVVDLDKMEIFQTHIQYRYTSYREDILKNILLQSQTRSDDKSLNRFKDPSIYIQKMVTEVYSLPMEMREIYLIHYMKLLLRKASFVVAYSQSNECLGINFAKKLKSDLNLPSESDVYTLFGVAEKLQLNLFISAIKLEEMERAFTMFTDGF